MNKRPLPCVLAGFVLGEVWIWQFHGTAALAALCFAAIIVMIIGVKNKGGLFILLSLGLLLGGGRQFKWQGYKDNLSVWKNGESFLIQGQVEEISKKEYSYSVVIDDVFINEKSQGGKLLLYFDKELKCQLGSRIIAEGSIEDFELPTNPGGFDQRSYREGKGILGVVYDAEIQSVYRGSFLIKEGIYNIREKTASYINEHMNHELAGIGIAMALGDKTSLLEEQKQLYEFGGISHVLAVSGLHMSLLGAAFYKLLRKAGCGYPVSVFSSVPCILIYAVMTGMSSSCLRAAIMLLIYLIAELKGYYYDLPSALSLAGIGLLYEIPSRLYDSGFLLSFGALISVGIICPFLFHLFEYKTGIRKVWDNFLSGLIIIIVTMPLSLYFFYGFSLAGLILNLIVIPLMSFVLPLIFLGGMGWLPLIPSAAADLCFRIAEVILKLYCFLCETAKKVSFSYLQAGYRGIGFAICYYMILFFIIVILFFTFKKLNKMVAYIGIVPAFFVLALFIYMTGKNDAFLTVLDVGQGDGIVYHTERGEVCLIDGGSTSEKMIGQYVIRPALEYYGISRVDYWFISHLDEDHISGLKELLEAGYPISNLILPVRKEKNEKQTEIEALARKNGTTIYYMKQGDRVRLNNTTFYCLYPKKNITGQDENQNSLVLLLETKHQQILLTGDVEKEGEDNMTGYLKKQNLSSKKERILKVAHHGSANGSKEEFLDSFKPDTAVISCSLDNSYGHPATETVDRLEAVGTRILYTMKQGAIEIRLGKETSYFGYGMLK